MPWTDEVWIKPDIERSFVLKKHLNFCNICVRMLSHVALVQIIFQTEQRLFQMKYDFFNPYFISVVQKKFSQFCFSTDIFWLLHCVGGSLRGKTALLAFHHEWEVTEPSKSQFPHLYKRRVIILLHGVLGAVTMLAQMMHLKPVNLIPKREIPILGHGLPRPPPSLSYSKVLFYRART